MQHPKRTFAHLACALTVVVLAWPVVLAGTVGEKASVEPMSLEALRQKVLVNEAKASLIRMEYRYLPGEDGNEPPQDSAPRSVSPRRQSGGKSGTHMQCTYAQDGSRVYAVESVCAGSEFIHGDRRVITGKIYKEGVLPDLMLGRIDRAEHFNWGRIGPLRASFRPFADNHLLSQLLVPQYTSILQERVVLDGREAAVVETRRPDRPTYMSRIWIDLHRGMPLQIEHYRPDGNGGHTLMGTVAPITLHQLPNGGWIAVEAMSCMRAKTRTNVSRYVVDVNSVSIEKKDIPDSLFDIQFSPGARIENAIATD